MIIWHWRSCHFWWYCLEKNYWIKSWFILINSYWSIAGIAEWLYQSRAFESQSSGIYWRMTSVRIPDHDWTHLWIESSGSSCILKIVFCLGAVVAYLCFWSGDRGRFPIYILNHRDPEMQKYVPKSWIWLGNRDFINLNTNRRIRKNPEKIFRHLYFLFNQ